MDKIKQRIIEILEDKKEKVWNKVKVDDYLPTLAEQILKELKEDIIQEILGKIEEKEKIVKSLLKLNPSLKWEIIKTNTELVVYLKALTEIKKIIKEV